MHRLLRFLDTTPEILDFVQHQFPQHLKQTKDKDNNVDKSTLTSQFPHNLQWYSERDYFGNNHKEPCVNLYLGEKDEFDVHHDGGAVTILLALSDYPEDYQGGGTEIFGPDKLKARKTFDHTGSDHNVILPSEDHDDNTNTDSEVSDHNVVTTKGGNVLVHPKAGTAMIWGTNMFHRALPILANSGMRAVWVGSFELKKKSGQYTTNF